MTFAPTPGRIANLNGLQLYFEVHRNGEPLVLLHGFSGTSQDWKASLHEWGDSF